MSDTTSISSKGGSKPAASRITIRDVARYADVSVTTASRALNDTGRMARETRERIVEVAAKLGYRPNSMARGLVSQRSFTIGLLTNDTYGRFTLPVAAGLSAAMVDRGVSVFLCAGEDDPQRTLLNLEAMQEKCVDGLVVSGKRIDRGLPVELPHTGIPTIYINAACPEGEVGFVPDDFGGAEAATLHLAGLGRRRIAHVTGPRNFAATGIRADGWLKALDRMGLAPWGEALFGEWSEAHGYRVADHLFGGEASRGTPDAVFCGNDQIARGMIDRLTEIGVRVPEDVAVVGYDNWEIFAKATRPPLTTVDMGLLELGRQAGLTMLDMIDGEPIPAGIRRTPCTVVVRESCGAKPGAD